MQSSPPERAWQRPTSPAGSQYSVDLAALDLESRSGATTPLPEQHIDRVRSEDIDGPSDFTLNMEKWFKGGTVGRGTAKSMKSGLQSVRETRDEGAQANGSFLTPRKDQDVEEGQSASHHTPSNSPPLDSVYHSQSRYRQTPVDNLSEWDPYTDGEEFTPEPPAHKQFLQPTVEDYYSELTPGRLPSTRRAKPSSSHTHVAGHEGTNEKDEPSSPGRPSSETLSPVRSPARSPVRSPVLQRQPPRQFSSQSTEATFERKMEDFQAKCKQLELLNAALGQAVDEERRMRTEEKMQHERHAADAERRERELSEMRDQAILQRDDYRQDLIELKAKTEQREREREETMRNMERLRQQQTEDARRSSEDVQREKSKQIATIRALEQDLQLARRERDAAEESERTVRAELDRHETEQREVRDDDDLDRMQSDLTQIEDPEDRVQELEGELHEVKNQMDMLVTAKKEAEEEANNTRAELDRLRREQDGETQRIASDRRRAVDFAEELQVQLKKLREQLQSEQTAHKAELERMQDATAAAPAEPPSPAPDLEALREELETKQTALNTALLERDALRDDLEAQQSTLNAAILERDDAQDALQEVRDALADREAVSTVLDGKVSAAIAKREAYWRGRLEASEKERKVMVKALLRQWGREEVGVVEGDERQEFEYQFVTRKSPKGRRLSGRNADMEVEAGA